MIGLHGVVRVRLDNVARARRELVDNAWVDRCAVGGDLRRCRPVRRGLGEERPPRGAVTVLRQQNVDNLAMLVDRALQVGPVPATLM